MVNMKLYTRPASFRAQKILIASVYAGVKLDVDVETGSKAIKDLCPSGKLPLLETESATISQSNSIARYICKLSESSKRLLGKDEIDSALVDGWMDFSANEIEVPACVYVYPIIGWMSLHAEASEKGRKDLFTALQILEAHLKARTFLVGERLSLADITIACALLLPFKLVLDGKNRKTFPCVTRWFTTCVNQPEFKKVIGETVLCEKALVADGVDVAPAAAAPAVEEKKEKKEKKPKEPKKEEKKKKDADEDDDEPLVPVEKKEKHYCDSLPPTTFVLDSWKRTYSNAKDCYAVMPWFWENLDKSGYSLYFGNYKYNEELKVNFMVSNLAGGFIQRCDEIRKYAFGVIQILQGENNFEIVSAWVFRGPSEKLILEANPDADSYEWIKADPNDEATKEKIGHLWCSGETINGKAIVDCKVFK